MTSLATALARAPQPRSPRATTLPYINLVMIEPEFQVIVDGFVGDLAEQGEVRNTDLLLLRAFEGGLSDLRLASRLPAIAHVGGGFGAPETTLLLPAYGAS